MLVHSESLFSLRIVMINKLGEYLYYRIMNDQERLARSKPRNLQGLYIGKRDIQSYVWDYFNFKSGVINPMKELTKGKTRFDTIFNYRRKDTILDNRNIHRYNDRIFHRVNHTRLKVNAIWVLNIF